MQTKEEKKIYDHIRYPIKQQRDKKLRAQILSLLGGKCRRCGISDPRVLQIDHVNGNGYKEIRKYGTGHPYYCHVRRTVKAGGNEYQLLCANCNWIKRYEKNEHG